ncbi:hypothetical protein TNCV_593011 [Trichonephila clavipes]|nr:hypothetical protein TNCV_593011 [Trichonephila clavipes]
MEVLYEKQRTPLPNGLLVKDSIVFQKKFNTLGEEQVGIKQRGCIRLVWSFYKTIRWNSPTLNWNADLRPSKRNLFQHWTEHLNSPQRILKCAPEIVQERTIRHEHIGTLAKTKNTKQRLNCAGSGKEPSRYQCSGYHQLYRDFSYDRSIFKTLEMWGLHHSPGS